MPVRPLFPRRDGPRAWVAHSARVVVAVALAGSAAGQEAQPPAVPADRTTGGPKIERYAEAHVRRFDHDGDGQLSPAEWQPKPPELVATIDRDHDGQCSVEELVAHIDRYSRQRSLRLFPQTRAGDSAGASVGESGIRAPDATRAPKWRRFFVPRDESSPIVQTWYDDNDVNGDGQVTLSEFAPMVNEIEVARFAQIDANGDGVIVPGEYKASLPPDEVPPSPTNSVSAGPVKP